MLNQNGNNLEQLNETQKKEIYLQKLKQMQERLNRMDKTVGNISAEQYEKKIKEMEAISEQTNKSVQQPKELFNQIITNLDKPYSFTYEQKKEKFTKVLNAHFGFKDVFPEVSNISDEDFMKMIELYEQKASINGKDPWQDYLYFDDLIIMQQALYEIVKNNDKYKDITSKVGMLFEQELNRRLQRSVHSYGEVTDETYRASYAELPEYAMTLADMCCREMEIAINGLDNFEEVVIPEHSLSTYKEIKENLSAAGIEVPEQYETIAQCMQKLVTLRAEKKDALNEQEAKNLKRNLIEEIMSIMYPKGLDYVTEAVERNRLSNKSFFELLEISQQELSQNLDDSTYPKR